MGDRRQHPRPVRRRSVRRRQLPGRRRRRRRRRRLECDLRRGLHRPDLRLLERQLRDERGRLRLLRVGHGAAIRLQLRGLRLPHVRLREVLHAQHVRRARGRLARRDLGLGGEHRPRHGHPQRGLRDGLIGPLPLRPEVRLLHARGDGGGAQVRRELADRDGVGAGHSGGARRPPHGSATNARRGTRCWRSRWRTRSGTAGTGTSW